MKRNSLSVLLVLAGVVLIVARGLPADDAAPDAQPATQPSTRPARIPVPRDETPLQAIQRGAKVFDQLDVEYASELFDASTSDEKEFVKAQCRYAVALTGVEHAIREKFGKEASDGMVHAVGEHTVEDFDKAKIEEDGEKVTIKVPGDDDPTFTMVHIDGVWKLSAADAIADLDAETVKGINEWEDQIAGELPALQKDIRDGKYKSAAQATSAVKELVNPPEPPPAAQELPTQKA